MNELIEMLRSCGNKYCADCPDVEGCAGPNYLMLKAAEELEKPRVSEGLDKVIAGMVACNGVGLDCKSCPYANEGEICKAVLWTDALAWLMKYKYGVEVDDG